MGTRWRTRAEAVDALKLHATQAGRQIQQDTRASGSRQIKFSCASILSKKQSKKQSKDPRLQCKCQFKAVLKKSMKKKFNRTHPWFIASALTDMWHHPDCRSRPCITLREAILHTNNTSHRRKVASIQDAKNKIACDNAIPKARCRVYNGYVTGI